jgi:histone-lysine N-methyltransferase SETD1
VAAAVRSGGTAAAGQQEEGEEEAPPADMPALRHSAPLLRQGRSALHGWGMFAGAPIRRGAFVVEYCGEVVSNGVADRREREYEASGDGTMYLFRLSRTAVIDATRKVG